MVLRPLAGQGRPLPAEMSIPIQQDRWVVHVLETHPER